MKLLKIDFQLDRVSFQEDRLVLKSSGIFFRKRGKFAGEIKNWKSEIFQTVVESLAASPLVFENQSEDLAYQQKA